MPAALAGVQEEYVSLKATGEEMMEAKDGELLAALRKNALLTEELSQLRQQQQQQQQMQASSLAAAKPGPGWPGQHWPPGSAPSEYDDGVPLVLAPGGGSGGAAAAAAAGSGGDLTSGSSTSGAALHLTRGASYSSSQVMLNSFMPSEPGEPCLTPSRARREQDGPRWAPVKTACSGRCWLRCSMLTHLTHLLSSSPALLVT
jgi:hypothetical protein